MTTSKRIGRKTFLTSTVAAFSAATLGSCSGESEGGDSDETGGTGTGGTATGGTATGGTQPGTGGTATGGSGGLATGGSATGGAGGATAGAPAGGTSGSGGMSAGGGTGGDGGGGGGTTYVCMAETNNGSHSHPLTIPSSHVERGYGEKGVPYILEDGGTGHTHTVELSPYEYIYLAGGTPIEEESSETNGHTHNCVVSCVQALRR